MKVVIADNGCGMSKEFLASVTDPFTTTRTTRRVGMGLPLFKESAELTGGSFHIESEKGVGTTVTAKYVLDSIDRMPLGDLGGTVTLLISKNDEVRLLFKVTVDNDAFTFDTLEVRQIIGEVSFAEPEIMMFLRDYVNSGIQEIIGGREII